MNRLDTRDRPAGKASRQAARQREREGCSQTMAKKSRYIVAEANRFFGPSAAFFGWQETALKTNNVMNQRSQDKSKCTDLSRVVLEGSVLESNMFQTSLAWLLNAQNFAFFIRLAFHAQCSCCQFPTEDFLRCVVYLIRQSVERERELTQMRWRCKALTAIVFSSSGSGAFRNPWANMGKALALRGYDETEDVAMLPHVATELHRCIQMRHAARPWAVHCHG